MGHPALSLFGQATVALHIPIHGVAVHTYTCAQTHLHTHTHTFTHLHTHTTSQFLAYPYPFTHVLHHSSLRYYTLVCPASCALLRPPAPSYALLAHSPPHQIVSEGKKRLTAEVSAAEAMDRINKLEHSLRNANILRKKAEMDAQHIRERLGEDATEDAGASGGRMPVSGPGRGRRCSVQTAVRVGKVKNENVVDIMAAQAKEQVRI